MPALIDHFRPSTWVARWERSGWPRLLAPAAFQFLSMAAWVLLQSAANAQVLSRYRPAALPGLYAATALLTVAGAAAFAQPAWRGKWTAGRAAIGAALFAWGLGGAVLFGHGVAALGAYLLVEVFTTIVVLNFWFQVPGGLDDPDSPRTTTRLLAVATLGAIAGGLLSRQFALHFGAGVLPFIGAALLMVAGATYQQKVEGSRTQDEDEAEAPARTHLIVAQTGTVWHHLRTGPHAGALTLLLAVLGCVLPLADFLFRERSALRLGEDALAALFGTLHVSVGLGALALQLLFVQRVLRGAAGFVLLSLVPIALVGFSGAALFTDALWPAVGLKVLSSLLFLTFLPIAAWLLYATVQDPLRPRVQLCIEGGVRMAGLGVAGLLLYVGSRSGKVGVLPVSVALLCFLAGLLVLWLRPSFLKAVTGRVASARAETEAREQTPSHEQQLAEALRSGEAERALRALSLLESARCSPRPHLTALLAHADPRVVSRGLELAVSLGATERRTQLEQLLAEGPLSVRPEAAWSLARLSPERAKRVLPAYLQSPDAAVRCASLGALFSLEPEGEAGRALDAMTALGVRAPAAERREVAKLLGRLGSGKRASALAQYLEDGDAQVRRVALRAVGEGQYVALAPRVLSFLTWRDERRTAREALVALGDAVVPLLEKTLADETRSLALRAEIPRVLRHLSTQAALEALLSAKLMDEPHLHYRVGMALARLREEAPALVPDEARVEEAIRRNQERYRSLLAAYRDVLAAIGAESLLTRALRDRLEQSMEVSFWLLGLLYPPRPLRRVHLHLLGPNDQRRQDALARFETLVPEKHRALVMEQVTANHRTLPPGDEGQLSLHLATLCHESDRVLRACARHVGKAQGCWSPAEGENEMSEQWVQRLFALEGVEMFSQCDVDDLAALAGLAREQTYRKGERIYDLGDPGDALYVIVKGRVLAEIAGQEVLVFGEREAFGEVSLLDGAPRPTGTKAVEDTTVLVLERPDFLDLIADRPQLLKSVFRATMRQFAHVIQFPRRGPALEPIAAAPDPEPEQAQEVVPEERKTGSE